MIMRDEESVEHYSSGDRWSQVKSHLEANVCVCVCVCLCVHVHVCEHVHVCMCECVHACV